MNRLSLEKRTQIIGLLVEGNGLRATSRLTGCSKNTVTKLLVEIGEACQKYHDEHVRNVASKRVQGTAIDSDSKLAISWLVGFSGTFLSLE